MTLTTTLSAIRSHSPCESGWRKLLKGLGGLDKYGLDTPLAYTRILDINGLHDCLWAIAHTMPEPRGTVILLLHAVSSAQDVQHLMTDQRSRDAVKVSHLFAHAEASEDELNAAWDASYDHVWNAFRDFAAAEAYPAVWEVVTEAAWAFSIALDDVCYDACEDAWDAARERQAEWLRVILENYEEA